MEEAHATFYFRAEPILEGGSLMVRISPKNSPINSLNNSKEYELQRGYDWRGDPKLEIRSEGDGTFIIEEFHRPTKWHINSNGVLTKIE